MISRTADRVFEIFSYKDSLEKELQCGPNPTRVFEYMGVGMTHITGEEPVSIFIEIYRN